MPITHKWYDEDHTIILMTYDGVWTLAEFHQMIENTRILAQEVTHPFVSIGDFTTSSTPPRNILSASSNTAKDWNPHYAGSILVRPGFLLQTLNGIMDALPARQNHKPVITKTFDEALVQASILINAKATHESSRE